MFTNLAHAYCVIIRSFQSPISLLQELQSPTFPRFNVVKSHQITFGNLSQHKPNIKWGERGVEKTNMALTGICNERETINFV